MCGIVGYVGKERCVEVLMRGLEHLEYRPAPSRRIAVVVVPISFSPFCSRNFRSLVVGVVCTLHDLSLVTCLLRRSP